MINTIINRDCIAGLREMETASVDCVVTSPPYYGLRDYGHDGQIGLEETPAEYVCKMVELFSEVRRVLKDDGTLWLNLGDSYAGSGKGQTRDGANDPKVNKTRGMKVDVQRASEIGLKNKDLIGIPWRVAFALQESGWYLRQDIIWSKPNAMPEPVTDRCTKSHEYIFLLTKSAKYHFDCEAIQEKAVRYGDTQTFGGRKAREGVIDDKDPRSRGGSEQWGRDITTHEYRRKRSVWTVATKPFREAHFATFPEDLVMPCVLAGCREGGVVLDPFMGAGTTAVVALRAGRRFIGFELNADYVEIANKRIEPYLRQLKLF